MKSDMILFHAVLLLLFCGAKTESTCKPGCPSVDAGFLKFKPGHVYEYTFESSMTVGVTSVAEDDDDDNTTLKITGAAKLFVEGNCSYSLQLSAFKINAVKESIERKVVQNIHKPIHFTMVSGKLMPNICYDIADTDYSLNIKRAVVSLLQSNKESEHEVDVFGHCPTHTSVTGDVITKVRNLNSCSHREHIRSGIINGIVNEEASIRSSMILQADYSKDVKLNQGKIESVLLVEKYKFTGASNGSPDIYAKVVSSLSLKNYAGSPATALPTEGDEISIIFQKPSVPVSKNLSTLKTMLAELVNLVSDYIKNGSAKQFVDFIRLMRNSDAETLLELGSLPHPNKVMARKVYLDGLFRAGTAESAKAIIRQLNKMEDKEKIYALISLNLVQTVDKDLINQAMVIIAPNLPKEAYLAIGNLISKYCETHNCSTDDIEVFSKKFTEILKRCKSSSKADEDRLLYILKGIGNANHLTSIMSSSLVECASTGRSNRLRVAALQAFSASSCELSLQQKALAILQDQNEDAELRIEAYLTVINCPSAELANKIAEVVNNEKVNQVGGFISSHLKSIRDSTDITREYQRHFLGNIRLTKHFPKDLRRFSFNNEFSYKLQALGASASADYKLIYSQHGFLPRAVKINVTSELFGTNFNIFEASLRQENIENLLEYFFGPKGIFNQDFIDVVKSFESAGGSGARARRSIADEVNRLGKKHKTYGSKGTPDLSLDISLKLFGSEMFFLSFGDNIPRTLDDILKIFSTTIDNVKREASEFKKKIQCHQIFMDTQLIYPTGLGIPLEMSGQGLAASIIDLGVNVDINSIMEQNWQRSKFVVKLLPSVEVQTSFQLGFNAIVLATGLRVSSQLHSASGGELQFSIINEGNGFNFDLELPREKLELVDFGLSTNFYIAEQGTILKSNELKTSRKLQQPPPTDTCFTQLATVGVLVCLKTSVQFNTQDSSSILETLRWHKPLNFQLYIISERHFNLKGYHVAQTPIGSQQWKLEFSTPKSKDNHDSAVTFEFMSTSKTYARLSFENIQQHFALEVGLTNDLREVVVYSQYEQNEEVRKNKVGFIKKGEEYYPIIDVYDKNGLVHDIHGYSASGKIIAQKLNDQTIKYRFVDFKITNKNSNVLFVFNGWTELGSSQAKSQLIVSSEQTNHQIIGDFQVQNGKYAAALYVNDEKTPGIVYGGEAYLKYSERSYMFDLKSKHGPWTGEMSSELEYSNKDGTNDIQSSQFSAKMSVKTKNQQVGSGTLNISTQGTNLEITAEVAGQQNKLSTSVKFNGMEAGQYGLSVNVNLNHHFLNLNSQRQLQGNRYSLDNVLSTSWGTSLTVKGEIGKRNAAEDLFIDLHGVAQLNSKDKLINYALKVVGLHDKTSSELLIIRDNTELIKYSGEFQHPLDKLSVAKLNLTLKNILIGKVDFKMAKNGKAELIAQVETQKTEPKHKLELNCKFLLSAPKYDLETTIILDSLKKLYFKTENTMDKAKHIFSSKTEIDISGRKVAFETKGSLKGELYYNGEIQVDFSLICPDGRLLDGHIKRKISTNAKTGVGQGQLELKLNDKLINGKKRSWSSTCKMEKFNPKTKELSLIAEHSFISFEGKHFLVSNQLKNFAKDGNSKSFDFTMSTKGDIAILPKEFSFKIEEYSVHYAKYHIFVEFPDFLEGNLIGNYNLPDEQNSGTFELKLNAKMPKTELKTFELNSKAKFLSPSITNEGQYLIELDVLEKAGTEQFVQITSVIKGSRLDGEYNFKLQSNKIAESLILDGAYERNKSVSREKSYSLSSEKYRINFRFENRFINSQVAWSQEENLINLHYSLDSSFDAIKNIDLTINLNQKEIDNNAGHLSLKLNELSSNINLSLYHSAYKKGLDMHLTNFQGQTTQLKGIFELWGEHNAKLTINLQNVFELDFDALIEASYQQIDNFSLKANWNSKKLKMRQFKLDILAQEKSLTLNLKNFQKVIIDGIASYALKQEKNKYILEGQGLVTYQEKSHNINFKLIRQVFEPIADKENGFSYSLNVQLGPKNSVSTLKLTNHDFNIKFSVCEEKKQCTNIQMQSTVVNESEDLHVVRHSLLALFDFRQLGYPYEFEFKSNTIKEGLQFQYSLDTSIRSNNNLKYQLIANLQPHNSKLQLSLPSREILIENRRQSPDVWALQGHYENSLVFFLDKTNQPNEFSRFVAMADVSDGNQNSLDLTGALSFEHPSIRPLKISGKFKANKQEKFLESEVVFDIFCKPEKKLVASYQLKNFPVDNGFNITTTATVYSEGFHYQCNGFTSYHSHLQDLSVVAEILEKETDVSAFLQFKINKDHIETSIRAFNEQLLHFTADSSHQKQIYKLDAQLTVLSSNSLAANVEVQPTHAKVEFKREGIVNFQGELIFGKELKISADTATDKLVALQITLDAGKFLESSFEINEEATNKYIALVDDQNQQKSKIIEANIKSRLDYLHGKIKSQMQEGKHCVPDLRKLQANYNNHLNSIRKELEQDPSLKQILEACNGVHLKLEKMFSELFKILSDTYNILHKISDSLHQQFEHLLSDLLMPFLKELHATAIRTFEEVQVKHIKVFANSLKYISGLLKEHNPTVKKYIKIISELLKPFNESAREVQKIITQYFDDLLREIKNYVSHLPSVEQWLKEIMTSLEDAKILEKILELINTIFDHLHMLPQTSETGELFEKLREYITAKLSQQSVLDEKFLEELLMLFTKAMRSLSSLTNIDTNFISNISNNVLSLLPLSEKYFNVLPAIIYIRVSAINFLLNENWKDVFNRDEFNSWIFFKDFELRGHILDGRHILTFDNQYYDFPGSCKYVLAQDTVDNNFTIISQLNNGKLKSLILTDKDGNYMEVNDAAVLKLNGKLIEFPMHENGMHAWRRFYTVWLQSEYGVEIMCTNDLKVCHIEINGFYTSKIRGLLGNGNAECYDDYLQIDGTISTDVTTFANGFSIGKCAPATATDKSIEGNNKRSDLCNDFFGRVSSLSMGYLVLDPSSFRSACDRAVHTAAEKDIESIACNIALAYASSLRMKHKLVLLPTQCAKCTGSLGQRDLGQEFTIKVPNNKADVVFVIDLDLSEAVLQKLISPTISEIRETLKTRGFTDSQVVVVAYKESQRYPAILTSDNGKINFQGNLVDVKLKGPGHFCDDCIPHLIGDKKMLEAYGVLESAVKSIIPQADEKAIRLALEYPFRAGAAKSIIVVRKNTLDYDNLFKFVRAHITNFATNFDGALLHMIAPIQNLSLEGVSNEKIVGFNSRLIATIDGKDTKKRPKLKFKNGMGIDFALNNGGWVFGTQSFEDLKQHEQRKFVSQITNSISDTLFKTDIVSDCECVLKYGLHAQHQCVIKSSNFVPNKKVKP